MGARRVFILDCQSLFAEELHSLFAEGLRSLLGQELSLEVVGVEADLQRALEDIHRLRPEVVLALSSGDTNDRLAGVIAHLARDEPGIRLISLNLASDSISVINSRKMRVSEATDLIRAILTE